MPFALCGILPSGTKRRLSYILECFHTGVYTVISTERGAATAPPKSPRIITTTILSILDSTYCSICALPQWGGVEWGWGYR